MLGELTGSRTALSTGQGPRRGQARPAATQLDVPVRKHATQTHQAVLMGPACKPPSPLPLRVQGSQSPRLGQFCFLSHRAGGSATVFAFTFQSKLEPPSPPPYPHRAQRLEDGRLGCCAEPSDGAEGGPALLPSLLGLRGLWCPGGPPSTSQGPASLYLWHPAGGPWAREPCRQGPGPSTPTQPGPGAVSDHSAEWPAATGAQLNMAVAGVSRQAAAQVSRDAQGSSARAGERVQGGSALQAPPLRVLEGPWAGLGVTLREGLQALGTCPPTAPATPWAIPASRPAT